MVCGEQVAVTEKRLRRSIANETCSERDFSLDWTRWVMSRLETDTIVLLVDETKLQGSCRNYASVGIAYEGRCIPLAWSCYQANSSAAYPPEGQVAMIAGYTASNPAGHRSR